MIAQFRGSYRFLSNFWPVPAGVTWDGRSYPTVEHAYQAAKFTDPEIVEQIRRAPTPGAAKRLASLQHAKGISPRAGWSDRRLAVMEDLLRQKFKEGTELCSALLATGLEELAEGNHWGDRFWGVDRRGEGENHLGKLLMRIRDDLRVRIHGAGRPGFGGPPFQV